MKYNNYTLYGIHDRTDRQLLVGYKSFISISSLIGDMLILVGSMRYKAIKLHEILVIFIQHFAVADLLLTGLSILPGAVSLAANEWILGEVTCYLSYFANINGAVVICQLISALALSKMLIVKYPLRAIHFSGKAAHLAACGMWACSLIFPVADIARDESGVYFSYLVYGCDYDCSFDVWSPAGCVIYSVAVGIFVLSCTAVTVVSSVMLIVEARRVAERVPGGLKWQGVITVLLTVSVHITIALPLAIYYSIQYFADSPYLYKTAWFIGILGVMANFYIFTLTLSSFREFLKSGIKMILAPLMKCCTADGDGRSVEEGERRRLLD